MFTTIAYHKLAHTTAALELVTGVADQHVRVSGNDIYVGDLNQVIAYAASGKTITDARLSSPSLRRVALEDIGSVQAVAYDADHYAWEAIWKTESPRLLESDEALNLLTQGTIGDDTCGVVLLADGPIVPVSGDIVTIGFTANIASTVRSWTNGAVTFEQTLPVGRYQIVGCDLFSTVAAKARAFRLVPIGEVNRPGGFTRPLRTATGETTKIQRMGGLGVWCEFDHLTPPTIDLLGGTVVAAADFEGVFDLIKIG